VGDGERGQIRFGATTIDYTILRSRRRRKTIEITIDPVEGVLVAAPHRTSAVDLEQIVARRAPWIVRRASVDALRPRRRQFVSGESVPYLGRQVRLSVISADVRTVEVRFNRGNFHLTVPDGVAGEARREALERALSLWYQARASARLRERVNRWAAIGGYHPPVVLIRSQRRRWGSCGADGTLRFNWRIIMAPPSLIDYVVVHELVHLRVRNHSAEFWAGVAQLMPDYKLRRAQLRELGASLAI
jgi:predicted metal-dependent hydrolase